MAVTTNQVMDKKDAGGLIAFPVLSGQTIYANTLVGIDAAGLLFNLTAATANTAKLVGVVADDSISSPPTATTASGSISGDLENSSAVAGNKTVRMVWTSGIFKMKFTAITQAMVGSSIYAVDNFDVDDTITGAKVGTLVTYLSATSGWVDLNKGFNRDGSFVITGALTAAGGAGSVLNVANPLGRAVLVEELLLNVSVKSTGAATGDFGIAATGISSDLLIDGTNLETTGYHSIGVNGGTNGKYGRVWASTTFLTGHGSAATTGLVGTYIAVLRAVV